MKTVYELAEKLLQEKYQECTKVQKDELEEKEEKREIKDFKVLDKLVKKLSEYLEDDEKALKIVSKIAEIVGTELEEHTEKE